MQLPFFIARRYLFAKKSHNVINIISLISAVGIAVGTAALVVVMSVYNGFENLVAEIYSKMEADLVIEPSRGKYFSTSSDTFNQIKQHPDVVVFLPVIEENVFITYEEAQGVASIKGVDSIYMAVHKMEDNLWEGDTRLYFGEIAQAVVGKTLASELGINIRFVDPIEIYFPKRNENISILNPLSSLNSQRLFPSGVVSIDQNADKKTLFMPFDLASSLIGLSKDEVSYVEIVSSVGSDTKGMKKEFSELLGEDFIIKDRYQQNETVYRMMNSEKVAIYLILLFIIIVISFNVFGSLTMLIIEKQNDITIFRTMGGKLAFIKRIFVYEGWLITLCGNIIGVAVGVALCIIQQQFGIIKMPGNFIITDYPVIIQPLDVVLTFVLVGVIGFLITSIPAWKTLPSIYNQSDSDKIE